MDIAGFGCEMSSDAGGSYDGLRGGRVSFSFSQHPSKTSQLGLCA